MKAELQNQLSQKYFSSKPDTGIYWANLALKNAKEYGLTDRVKYVISDATKAFPFNSNTFDAVISNGSLHEWSDPIAVFNDILRVLKTGGRFFISDLKRNLSLIITSVMKMMTKTKSMKQGLITSVNAAYLKNEILAILSKSNLGNFNVRENFFGLIITGIK